MNYEALLAKTILKNNNYIILTAENRAAIRNIPNVAVNNFIDFGIAEQTMIGAAAGLALRGRKPIAHALATFLVLRAYEFIRTDIGIANLNVKLVGGVPGFLSEANGPTHQAVDDIAVLRAVHNMNIFCSADEDDMIKCLPAILEDDKPWYIRFNNLHTLYKHSETFTPGKAEVIQEGKDITFLVYGMMFNETRLAVQILEKSGLSVGLINLRTLEPIDEEAILKEANKSSLIVTVEDHYIKGGLYSILSELLVREGVSVKVHPIALKNKFFKPLLMKDLLEYHGFTGEQIANCLFNKYFA